MSLPALKKKYRDAILDGMARALWLDAYVRFAEDFQTGCMYCGSLIHREANGGSWVDDSGGDACADNDDSGVHEPDNDDTSDGVPHPRSGEDWDDYTPDTPDAAYLAARALTKLLRESEGVSLPDLFELAMTIDEGEFQFDEQGVRGASEDQRKERDRKLELAEDFGNGLANEALGNGVSWGDNHRTKSMSGVFDPVIPRFEIHYDGEELTWEGYVDTKDAKSPAQFRHVGRGRQSAKYEEGKIAPPAKIGDIVVVNANDESWTSHRYVIGFGNGATKVLVYANNEGEALDEAIDWVVENAPGHVIDDEVTAAYDEAIKRGVNEDKAREDAEEQSSAVSGGNAGTYVRSTETAFMATDPEREELLELAGFGEAPHVNPTRNPGGPGAAWGEGGDVAHETQEAVRDVVESNATLAPFDPEVFSTLSPEGKAYLAEYEKNTTASHGSKSAHHATNNIAKQEAEATKAFVFVQLSIHAATSASDSEIRDLAHYGMEQEVIPALNRAWPVDGFRWQVVPWGWGYMQIQTGGSGSIQKAMLLIGLRPIARQNPRGLTAKGERMYEAIRRGYTAVGNARAKEVAARTVLSQAKHGARGLVKPASPPRARRARGGHPKKRR